MPEQEEYIYGCNSRPPMLGTVPNGWLRFDESDTSTYNYGVVVYPHKLTKEEIYSYQLHPASENARRFQIGDSVDWCGDKCIVVKHYSLNGYIRIQFDNNPDFEQDVREWDGNLSVWIIEPPEPKEEGPAPLVEIDIDSWEDEYEIVCDEHGTYLEVDANNETRVHQLWFEDRLWVQTDDEFITNGKGIINRVRYLETKKPCFMREGTVRVYNDFYHEYSDELEEWTVREPVELNMDDVLAFLRDIAEVEYTTSDALCMDDEPLADYAMDWIDRARKLLGR